MNLRFHVPPEEGCVTAIPRQKTGLEYLEFDLLHLKHGAAWQGDTGAYEAVIVILGGHCDLLSGSERWEGTGRRADVFEGKATAVYLPPHHPFSVTARDGEVTAAICKASSETGGAPQLILPDDVKTRIAGAHNWRREIHDIAGANVAASRLLVGETYNDPGAWSSYPPHKHDVAGSADEVKLEEIYYFRVQPPQGFGIQRIYSADGAMDEVYAIRDGDAVVIPRGYHPVAAAPGYRVYYLWMLAGPERVMRPRDDPDHAWVHTLEK